jgi:hypothetical protein
MGIAVLSLARMGQGVPDLLLSYGGFTMLAEVKMPKGELTEEQKRFKGSWQGGITIVRDLDGVETTVRYMRAMAAKLRDE